MESTPKLLFTYLCLCIDNVIPDLDMILIMYDLLNRKMPCALKSLTNDDLIDLEFNKWCLVLAYFVEEKYKFDEFLALKGLWRRVKKVWTTKCDFD